jgi:hypothetical protein
MMLRHKQTFFDVGATTHERRHECLFHLRAFVTMAVAFRSVDVDKDTFASWLDGFLYAGLIEINPPRLTSHGLEFLEHLSEVCHAENAAKLSLIFRK